MKGACGAIRFKSEKITEENLKSVHILSIIKSVVSTDVYRVLIRQLTLLNSTKHI